MCITRRGSAFLTHHTVPFKFFISFYCGDSHTPNISGEQRIALLDEQSHVDVFPIIWPAVILWRCTTGWKLLKSKVMGKGPDSRALFFQSEAATGLNVILFSILEANLHSCKNQYLVFIFSLFHWSCGSSAVPVF